MNRIMSGSSPQWMERFNDPRPMAQPMLETITIHPVQYKFLYQGLFSTGEPGVVMVPSDDSKIAVWTRDADQVQGRA